ncbi:MAG: n-acetylglutamate synthase [Saprospiraceae bacterium]
MNYQNKKFRAVSNTSNGEVSGDTLFHYHQTGNIVTAKYGGGGIVHGHLIALVDEQGLLDMRYHHVNVQGELQTGICHSKPEVLSDGRIRLHETWQWTSGDGSKGSSVVEEIWDV